MKGASTQTRPLEALREVLDGRARVYRELAGAPDLGSYLRQRLDRDDEELLTEPLLADILERVLGFPPDAYFPQLGKSGLKPDFTPMDLIAQPFVLDAKSSRQRLPAHEDQIRSYIGQRQLDFGVLFNLRDVRVYRRGAKGHDPNLSFSVERLWRLAHEEALAEPDFEAFQRFVEQFAHRPMGIEEKIEEIRTMPSWEERGGADELHVDVDLLVAQLRKLSRVLAEDADSQPEALADHLKLNPGFEARLLEELAAIAQDIRPSSSEGSLSSSVMDYRSGSDLERRTWRQYTVRVAQLTLARILLYRAWEDAGFIREQLYDGGFRDVYDQLGEKVRDVLSSAFAAGAQRYQWLFEQQSTYDWYRPREWPLVEVLYSFTQFPLDRLDADVLGGLYESYVDEIDRDRLGQFYTPRDVVRFMLDRAGFSGPDGVMRIEGDERKPVRSFDFASGSGGFDVEIARRVIDEAGALHGSADLQLEALRAITTGLHAIEISPFPYYLTEINLLLQVSRLLAALGHAQRDIPPFVLSVVHEDALKAKPTTAASFEGLEAEQRADHARLKADERFDLALTLDPEKQAAFTRMREGGFDLVVGNPPYVSEANNKPLFERLRRLDAWKGIYRGKSDYYYYFLYMAAELLAPGGRLCVIVPASWMNAGNAEWLREKLASTLRLDELFLFGSYRLFAPSEEARGRTTHAPTPTVESAILVATKAEAPKGHKLRVVALEDEVEAARTLSGDSESKAPGRRQLLAEMSVRAVQKDGRSKGIHAHGVTQAELRQDQPWPVKHGEEDLARRIVVHLDSAVAMDQGGIERLGHRWLVFMGIETGADSYSPRLRTRMERSFPDVVQELDRAGCAVGEPIMELPRGAERREPWVRHPEYLAQGVAPQAILYGAFDEGDYTNLVWLDRTDEPPEHVIVALERWKPVLKKRAEFVRNPERRWWECAWPRDKDQLRTTKVIGVHRTNRGRFATDDAGSWQSGKGGVVVVPRGSVDPGQVTLLCGYLNSELLDLWYGVRGRTPRDVWRDYEPKPMSRIPYRHVDLSVDAPEDRLKSLEQALEKGDASEAAKIGGEIGSSLRAQGDAGLSADSVEAVEAARALEAVVRAVADNRRALLPSRDRFPDLARVVKDPWSTEVVDPAPGAFVDDLPKEQRASIRVDPELHASIDTDGTLGTGELEGDELVFTYRRKRVASVKGPREKLVLLAELVADQGQLAPADLLAAEVPRDVEVFRQEVEAATAEVQRLLGDGRVLVEAAERLVCALYGLPSEMEDEVVAHADARARSAAVPAA